MPQQPHRRRAGSLPHAHLLLVVVLVVLVAAVRALAFQPAASRAGFGQAPLRRAGRARGDVLCKKGSGGSSSGPPASKGFGFGVKKDPLADKYKYSGRLKPGVLSPVREVPADIMRPDYALDGYVRVF